MKSASRKDALSRRKTASTPENQTAISTVLEDFLSGYANGSIAGYLPIRTEADPRPAMTRHASAGWQVGVPVVTGSDQPLEFRLWTPEVELRKGAFDVLVPCDTKMMTPEIVIVPMAAFDARGYRLGYGGGFYDRTLRQLRGAGGVLAIGLAFSAQEVLELPVESTDEPLDGVVCETGLRWFAEI